MEYPPTRERNLSVKAEHPVLGFKHLWDGGCSVGLGPGVRGREAGCRGLSGHSAGITERQALGVVVTAP